MLINDLDLNFSRLISLSFAGAFLEEYSFLRYVTYRCKQGEAVVAGSGGGATEGEAAVLVDSYPGSR